MAQESISASAPGVFRVDLRSRKRPIFQELNATFFSKLILLDGRLSFLLSLISASVMSLFSL